MNNQIANGEGTMPASGANWIGDMEWAVCNTGMVRYDWRFKLTPGQSPSRFYVNFLRYGPVLPSTPWGTHWDPAVNVTFVNGTPAGPGTPEVQSTIVFDNTPVTHTDDWRALTVSGTLKFQKSSTAGSRLIRIVP